MSVGSRIKEARKQAGLTQKKLAEMLKVSVTAIRDWESDKYSPNLDRLDELAKALKTDPLNILELGFSDYQEISPDEKRRIRQMRNLDAWELKLVDDFLTNIVDLHFDREIREQEIQTEKTNKDFEFDDIPIQTPYLTFPFFPDRPSAGTGSLMFDQSPFNVQVKETPEAKKADFVLQVDGDSMEPRFSNDDFVLIKKQDVVDNGEVGIFLYDGNVYIKQLKDDLLHSLNPEYDDILIDGEIICFGKVLGKAEL